MAFPKAELSPHRFLGTVLQGNESRWFTSETTKRFSKCKGRSRQIGVRHGAIWFVLFAAGVTAAEPINPDDPPPGRFSDDWAEIYIAGTKSGYAHSTMTRDGDRLHSGTVMKLKVGRTAQTVELSIEQETTESLAGEPIRFVSTMDMASTRMVTRGTVDRGRVTIVSSQFGMDQTQTFDYPSGAFMTWGAYRESLKRGFKPGTEYTLVMYAPELRMDGPVSAKTNVGEWETFSHRGKEGRGQRVTVTMQSPVGSIEMISWVDESGKPLKAKVPVAGLADMELITTDQATAMADFLPPEIFMTTVIKSPRPLDRTHLSRIRFRLSSRLPEVRVAELPTTGQQTVERLDEGSVELVVVRQTHRAQERRDRPTSPPDDSEYLGSNLMMNTRDPMLTSLAARAAADEKEPFKLADRLRRFVTDYISAKTMNIGFATANEVARTKEGDCSEHAVLLAALGRIQGLPSRVVAGLAYAPFFGGQDDIFGYHMWTQFWIDGRWFDFDAALRETECSPARIALAVSSLKDAGLADLSLPLLSTIGALDLKVIEIENGSRQVP
jgi:hypothetical protein